MAEIPSRLELITKVTLHKRLHKPKIPVDVVKWRVKMEPEFIDLYKDTFRLIEKVVKNVLFLVEKILENYKVRFPKKIVISPSPEEFVVSTACGRYDADEQVIYLYATSFLSARYASLSALKGWAELKGLKEDFADEGSRYATEFFIVYYLMHELGHHIIHLKYPEVAERLHEPYRHEEEEMMADTFADIYTIPLIYAHLDCDDSKFKKFVEYVSVVNYELTHSTPDELLQLAKYWLADIFAGGTYELASR